MQLKGLTCRNRPDTEPNGPISLWQGGQELASRFALTLAAGGLLLLLVGCTGGVLDPQGPVGSAQKTILLNSLAIMLAIVIPTIIATLGTAWWFRAGNEKARYQPDFIYSGQIELVVWAVPAMVVILVGGIAWIGSHDLEPSRPLASSRQALEVDVVSLDWKWLFIYPQSHVASVNKLVIPTGTPVTFRLTSATVMNSFFVPQLGSQIYSMAGMSTQLNLQADRDGTYKGLSAQFSGEHFADMDFLVQSVPMTEFGTWIDGVKGQGPILDETTYTMLAKPGTSDPMTFRSVTPHLYDTIMDRAAGRPQSAPDSPKEAVSDNPADKICRG